MRSAVYPKISIVMPSFNQVSFLEASIRSVLSQNYPNLEYMIIDGGSTDGSVEVIRRYEEYLDYWVSEPDEGHGAALNKGFRRSTGEIMAWLNSDDLYAQEAFFNVARIFENRPEVEWVVGKNSWWNERGDKTNEAFVFKNIYDFLTGQYAWIQQESVFWRRSLWETSGARIDESYRFMVDGELWTRFFLKAKLWHADTVLSGYRSHATNRAKLYSKEVSTEMKRAIEDLHSQTPSSIRKNIVLFKLSKRMNKALKKCGVEFMLEAVLKRVCPEFGYPFLQRRGSDWTISLKF